MVLDWAGATGCTVLADAAGTGATATGLGATGSAAASRGRGRGNGGGLTWLVVGGALTAGVRVGATGTEPTEATAYRAGGAAGSVG